MEAKSAHNHQRASILALLVPLLNSDTLNFIFTLWQFARRIIVARVHEGMYEVLEHDVRLELLDSKGETSVYFKRQLVRFLQDNIIAFQDQAWGDGDIFADYKCSPGAAVDRYREGYLYRVLISLRGAKQRGDVEEFHIERTIKDGFIEPIETLQTDVNVRTGNLLVSLIFPKERFPTSVRLIERFSGRSVELGPEHIQTLPDSRLQVSWRTQEPRLFEAYILRWEW